MAGVCKLCVLVVVAAALGEVTSQHKGNRYQYGNTPLPSDIVFPNDGDQYTRSTIPYPPSPPSNPSGPGCVLPNYPHNRFSLVSCSGGSCSRQPGQKSPLQNMINITCDHGYHLLPADTYMYFLMINCKKDGDWWRPIPECIKKEPSAYTSAGCLLPAYPPHVVGYKLWKCDKPACEMQAGRTLAHKSNVFITCEPGYATAADQDTPVCEDGRWTKPIPQCYKMCPQIVTNNDIEAVCGETEEVCDTPQPFNITATFTCPESMSPSNSDPMKCGPDGRWSSTVPTCEIMPGLENVTITVQERDKDPEVDPALAADPGCGLAQYGNSVDPATITGRAAAKVGNFPWHAAIFRKVNGEFINVCSGALITKKHILTAGDCVVKRRQCNGCHPPVQKMRPSELMVALGKTKRSWNPRESNEIRRGVKIIKVRDSYLNLYVRQKDYSNIAVIQLDSPVPINKLILPVCLKLSKDRVTDPSTTTGIMSGWGRGAQCSAGDRCNEFSSDNLLYDTKVVSKSRECFAMLRNANYFYVIENSPYHLCTPNNRDVAENIVDPGAGLTVKINDQHYLEGVFIRQVKDNSGGFGLLSRVNSFERFISDETREVSSLPGCQLPDYPNNVYEIHSSCSGSSCSPRPGAKVQHNQLVTVTCRPGYRITSGTTSHATCNQGKWTYDIPRCDNVCPALTSSTLNLECWQGPNLVGCNQPQPPNTIVKFKCKPYYSLANTGDPTYPRCGSDGQWSSGLPTCKPECGHSNLNSAVITPVIVNGEPAKAGNVPWHAGVFHNEKGAWINVCGGTLITTRHVVTAAHCVTLRCDTCKPEVMSPAEIMVALGKNHKNWDFKEDTEVKRSVSRIHAAQNYRGQSGNFDRDIAVLVLDGEVTINPIVMPACLDLESEHVRKIASANNFGIVSGWGNIEECKNGQVCKNSDTLQYGKTRIHFYNECQDLIQSKQPNLLSRLSTDKLCTEYGKESIIQKGDSGGGLVFQFGRLHFIYGVTSVKLNLVNEKHSIGTFTDITENLNWIRGIVSS